MQFLYFLFNIFINTEVISSGIIILLLIEVAFSFLRSSFLFFSPSIKKKSSNFF